MLKRIRNSVSVKESKEPVKRNIEKKFSNLRQQITKRGTPIKKEHPRIQKQTFMSFML